MEDIYNKITSQFSEVTKRILIVLYIISLISMSILLIVVLAHDHRIDGDDVLWTVVLFSIPLIGFWIPVAVVNWIKKGAIK